MGCTHCTVFHQVLDVICDSRPEDRFFSQEESLGFTLMCCVQGFEDLKSKAFRNNNAVSLQDKTIFQD